MGAAAACTAGPYGNTCGTKWYINSSDGTSGLGQQLAAMEVFYALLVNETIPPGKLPNVIIRDVPVNATSIAPILPSDTSSPLVGPGPDSDAAGTGIRFKTLMALMVALGAAFALL